MQGLCNQSSALRLLHLYAHADLWLAIACCMLCICTLLPNSHFSWWLPLLALVWPQQENAADRREVAPTGCHMIGAGSLRFDTRDACGTGTLVILFVFSQWRGFSIFLKQG